MKVPELKAEAKRLGLRGYSHKRKPELISLIVGSRTSPILDDAVPEINSEILKPTKYVKPRIDETEAKKQKRKIRELEEMLGLRRRRIIPEIKVWNPEEENLHRKIRKIKEIIALFSVTCIAEIFRHPSFDLLCNQARMSSHRNGEDCLKTCDGE